MIKKRYAAFLPLAAAAAMLASGPTSAGAAVGAGAGTIAGAVSITSPSTGIPLSTPAAISYTFASTVITGVVACNSGGTGEYVGTINVSASGSGFGDQIMDSGSVNGTIATGISPTGATIAGNITGSYTRVGSNVLVTLTGSANITSPTGSCSGPMSVTVESEFIPDSFAPGTTNPNHAQFVGVFADASVA